MANAVLDTLAQSDTGYNLVQRAREVSKDILNTPLLKTLLDYGIINTDGETIGDTVRFYNKNRIDSNGISDIDDAYASADSSVFGYRELIMGAVDYAHKVKKKDTMAAIRAETSVGNLRDGDLEQIAAWGKLNVLTSVMNQAAGNVATSIDVPGLSTTAFSGTSLPRVSGSNTITAVNSLYSKLGNNAAGGISNASQITSLNPPTLLDFMSLSNVIFNVYSGVTPFSTLDSMGKANCRALVVISRSGWNLMLGSAPSADNYPSAAFELYNVISASGAKKSEDTGRTIGNYRIHRSAFTPDLDYLVVDDHLMPRASYSTSAVANTRVALILGRGAVDMKVAKLYGSGKDGIPFIIKEDTEHEKLNTFDYYRLCMKYGVKRATMNGFGANAATVYDNAVAVLSHYSPL